MEDHYQCQARVEGLRYRSEMVLIDPSQGLGVDHRLSMMTCFRTMSTLRVTRIPDQEGRLRLVRMKEGDREVLVSGTECLIAKGNGSTSTNVITEMVIRQVHILPGRNREESLVICGNQGWSVEMKPQKVIIYSRLLPT